MKFLLLASLLLLGACSSEGGLSLGGTPGINVAEAALRGGSPQIALQVADSILAKDRGNVTALCVQGDALTVLGRYDDAAESYQRALSRDSSASRALIGLGRLRLATDPAAAEDLFLQVLQRDPRNTTALNDLGIARDLQRRHNDAQRAYAQALGIDPNLTAAQVNMALSLAMSGRGAEAVKLIRPLAETPDASRKLRHDYAAVLALSGNRTEAERILKADMTPAEVAQAMTEFERARETSTRPATP
jgi:Flp pilus assembly protein TadD